MVSSVQSREETRFLALLAKTQERASNLGGRKKKRMLVAKENENGEESGEEEEVDWRLPKVSKQSFSLVYVKIK